jgi:hypothetical protein
MAIAETGRMTLEEFRALPEGPPYYEFEEGKLIPMGSPTVEHQDLVGELASLLRRFVRERKRGRVCMEVDVYLPDDRVYIPDISFVSTERVDDLLGFPDRKIHGAPDLVVEVTSSNPERDRVRKFRVYYEICSSLAAPSRSQAQPRFRSCLAPLHPFPFQPRLHDSPARASVALANVRPCFPIRLGLHPLGVAAQVVLVYPTAGLSVICLSGLC